ncbi:uncharacterized protein [Phyllobates terribilis]|uniref:uncharacterized protein n=1 Tax=Phyllobates terribilis TaxID=111132 RepID=UPI003CCA87C5
MHQKNLKDLAKTKMALKTDHKMAEMQKKATDNNLLTAASCTSGDSQKVFFFLSCVEGKEEDSPFKEGSGAIRRQAPHRSTSPSADRSPTEPSEIRLLQVHSNMEEEKLSVPVQDTGTEPWVADKGTQTEEDDYFKEESAVCIWEDAVDPKTLDYPRDHEEDLRQSGHGLHLRNTSGTAMAAPSAMGLDTPLNWTTIARTTTQNLHGQATFSTLGLGDPDPMGVSRMREPQVLPKKEDDYHFYKHIQEIMEPLPPEKKGACKLEILQVVYKHGLAQVESSKKPNHP